MVQLIMVRHGESCWNKADVFTGWVDIPLSTKGVEESFAVGDKIADLPIDLIITSSLIRTQLTACLAMTKHHSKKVPVVQHLGNNPLSQGSKIYSPDTAANCIPMYIAPELNERMYGELQGLNKTETRKKFGEEQVKLWRRSYDVQPPHGESLQMTAARVIPYFKKKVIPDLKQGKNVLICAHGNSLRAICMEIEGLNEEQILHFEIPTGEVLIYHFEHDVFKKKK